MDIVTENTEGFYNPRFFSDESLRAWNEVPHFLRETGEQLEHIALTNNASVHFKGSTLTGQMTGNSDVDLMIVVSRVQKDKIDEYLKKFKIEEESDRDFYLSPSERLRTYNELTDFRDKLGWRLDGDILVFEDMIEDVQRILEQIEKIRLSEEYASEDLRLEDYREVMRNNFWVIFNLATFLGSQTIYELSTGTDQQFKSQIINVIFKSFPVETGSFFWDYYVSPMFEKFILNYEYNDPQDPMALDYQLKGKKNMDRVIKRERPKVTDIELQRIMTFLRNARSRYVFPSAEEILKRLN